MIACHPRSLGKAFFLSVAMAGVVFVLGTGGWAADLVDQVETPVTQAVRIRQAAQAETDRWVAERQDLQAAFERLEIRTADLRETRDRLTREVAALESRLADDRHRIENLEGLQAQIAPFLQAVGQRLDQAVRLSSHFLREERERRLLRLQQVMDDPGAGVGERYRRIMEALRIEADYGRTLDVYPERIVLDGQEIEVDVLRLGRLCLLCQSLDGRVSGRFDPAAQVWVKLAARHNRDILRALEIARKHRPAEMLTLPLGRVARP